MKPDLHSINGNSATTAFLAKFQKGLNGEIFRFLVVGGMAALLDLGIYLALTAWGLPTFIAKLVSFVAAGMVAYLAHKTITFRNRTANALVSIPLFFGIYTITLGLNVLANEGLLALLHLRGEWGVLLAWGGATALSATVNFLGGKLVVFRH